MDDDDDLERVNGTEEEPEEDKEADLSVRFNFQL